MRKYVFLALVTLFCGFQMMDAVPARPGKFTVTQPDGTRMVLQRHGDEWGHWMTDALGRMVRQDENGFYRVVSDAEAATVLQQASTRRNARRNAQEPMRSKARKSVRGQRHFLVILVEFSDLSFKEDDPNQAFTDLMNEPGYSVSGGTGSARDYYSDNSHGDFEPVFDVYGPVKLKNKYSYYGKNDSWGNDTCPEDAVIEGCQGLDDQIDFSRYDSDGDGVVDLVFMYYAGYGEADSSDSNSIWPHQWGISSAGKELILDEVRIDSYACSNEIVGYGALSGQMTGIGTACHEFGHAMGLPDFYDTDYETNGEAGALYSFSVMCAGAYNNEGRTPPYFNYEERMLLGWVKESDYLEFKTTGDYTIPPIDENVAYRTFTDMDGEYFIYENRTKTGWDRHIPGAGMVVYHVDKSSRVVSSGYWSVTAYDLWNNWTWSNSINAYGSHPCFYIIPAANQTSLNYYSERQIPFPCGDVNTYVPKSWNGVEGNVTFSEIAFSGGLVTLHARVFTGDLDYVTITDAGSYKAGDRFNFGLTYNEEEVEAPAVVEWYFDDEPVRADSVTLTRGAHVVEAVLTLSDDSRSVLTLEIEAE